MLRLLSQSLATLAAYLPVLAVITVLIYLPINFMLTAMFWDSADEAGGWAYYQANGFAETLFGVVASGFATIVAWRSRMGEPVRFTEALGGALRHWPSLVGGSILYNLGVMAGFVALVIPGVFLALGWSVLYPVIIIENSGPTAAFSRSAQLMSGRRWPMLGCNALIFVGMIATSTVLYTLIEFLPYDYWFAYNVAADTIISGVALLWPVLMTVAYLEARAEELGEELPDPAPADESDGQRTIAEDESNPYRSPQY
ncbi:hypothetical protein Pla123a_09430 [Posidoniimonas polymericola]|uniref:Glycerophosphoryl diester phosphodiesterase membrane domain-containing protein n=1 Tax=Posidoniimonas polymericola TaxID=2528002 RepID=A0A5C5YTZ1_9BACT|nr:hypothetical protein [Posidoniimonas polymericola]TWT78153.1 hypothetical protein Pla123a_09430 [Posidoniimonas polymericola]